MKKNSVKNGFELGLKENAILPLETTICNSKASSWSELPLTKNHPQLCFKWEKSIYVQSDLRITALGNFLDYLENSSSNKVVVTEIPSHFYGSAGRPLLAMVAPIFFSKAIILV